MVGKVLICDDEPNIVESLSYIVKKLGLAFVVAGNGVQAIELARRENPDLIFLDVGMPDMDGYQACKELKSDPSTNTAYVIMLTAHGQRSDEFSAKQAGADEFMTKPFSPRRLSQRLEQIMAR